MELRHMSNVVLHNKKTDYIEELCGGMKCFQVLTVLSGYCCEILIAWSVLSHGILVPGNTQIYCATTNHTLNEIMTQDELKVLRDEACSEICSEIVVDNKYYDNTIIHQYELYCNGREVYTAACQFVSMLGVFCGNFFFGMIGAKYGRKLPIVISVIAIAAIGFGAAFSPNIWVYMVCRFIWNIFIGGTMTNSFILYSELVGVRWRPTVGLLAQIPFALGHLLLAFCGYFHRDWRWFTLNITLPSILLIHYIWTMPESPQWLISVGRVEQAIKVMEFIARRNHMPTDQVRLRVQYELEKEKQRALKKAAEDVLARQSKTQQELEHEPKEGRFRDLFDGGLMTFLTVGSWCQWFAIFCCYYGIAQMCGSLGNNLYLSFALSALTQQPSVLFAWYTLNFWGRKWSLLMSNSGAFVSLICIICVPSETYKIIPAIAAMFFLGMSYPGVFVYTVELFPTPSRTIGMGSSSAIGSIGAMLAALIVETSKIKGWLPPAIFATLMGLACLLVTFMPETKGHKLARNKNDLLKIMQQDKMNCFAKKRFRDVRRSTMGSITTIKSTVSLHADRERRMESRKEGKEKKEKDRKTGIVNSPSVIPSTATLV